MFDKEVENAILRYLQTSKMRYLTLREQKIYYNEFENHIFKIASFNVSEKEVEKTITNNYKFYVYKIKDGLVVKENDGTNKLIYHPYSQEHDIVIDFEKCLNKRTYSLNYENEELFIHFTETAHNTITCNVNVKNKKYNEATEVILTRTHIKILIKKIQDFRNIFDDTLDFELNNADDFISIANLIYIDTDYYDKEYYATVCVDINNNDFDLFFLEEEYDKILNILKTFS